MATKSWKLGFGASLELGAWRLELSETSPRLSRSVLRLGGGRLAHGQAALVIELETLQKPTGLLRGKSRFLLLAFTRGSFLLAGWGALRCQIILIFVLAGAGRHLRGRNATLQLFQFGIQLVAFAGAGCAALLELAQSIYQPSDLAVHHIGIMTSIGLSGIEFNRTLEITGSPLPLGQGRSMSLQGLEHGFFGSFQLTALAAAIEIGNDDLLQFVAFQRIIGHADGFIALLGRFLTPSRS